MKGVSTIFAIIVLVLWLASATYIAAPSSVVKLPSPPMGNIPPAFLGVLLFLLSIVIIVIWADLTPEDSESKENKATEVKKQ